MKIGKRRPPVSGVIRTGSEVRAQVEFEKFLKALSSYPERVARDPALSFERHLCSLACTQRARAGEDRRRGCAAREPIRAVS